MLVPHQDRLLVRLLQAAAHSKTAGWSMDQFARLSLLEGAAGVPPGTWLRKKERGFGDALEHFGPRLAAAWTATTDQGVYDKAVASAAPVLRNVPDIDAEDLVQDLVLGSTSSAGPARQRIFYSIGNALRKYDADLVQGKVTPTSNIVLGTVHRWVERAARSVLKSSKHKHEQPFDFGPARAPSQYGLQNKEVSALSDDEREGLFLLALQSPGGPGRELRRTIDHLIGRHFLPSAQPIVRAFLQKISQPKYRSQAEMQRLVANFNPKKWFTQAYNHVRGELRREMNLSSQQLTNALGGNAKKVFDFMHHDVGRDPAVQRMIKELAQEIDVLEPGVGRVAKHSKEAEDRVIDSWLEGPDEREARLEFDTALASAIDDAFEKDDMWDWQYMVSPDATYSRGPSVLRIATKWLEKRQGT